MPDEHKFIPLGKTPDAAADELLRLLSQQNTRNGDDDILENPELEQLFDSLSLEEPESAQSTAVLTLDDLLLGTPAAMAAPDGVACSDCGARNPAATRFCGMCGYELGKSSTAAKNGSNGNKQAVTVVAVPELPSVPQEPAEPARTGRGWKIAFLMLLCLVLSVVMYQQLDWQLPVWSTLHSLAEPPAPPLPQASPAPTVSAEPAGAPPAAETQSGGSRSNVSNKPSPPPKPAPAVTPHATESPVQVASEATEAAAPAAAPKPETQERAPSIAAPTSPIELPTIVRPPTASPALQGSHFAGPATPAPKMSGGFTPAVPILKVAPQIPPSVRHVGLLGAVVLHARVGTDGTVQDVSVVSGNPRLVNAAIEAVKKWRYRPFMLDGKPVEGETNITLNFKSE